MSDWIQNSNGNYVYVIDKDDVMTVFKRKDGEWSGVYDGKFLRGSFNRAEEAQVLMEKWVIDGDKSLAAPTPKLGWRPAQKGGFYKNADGGLATVKQAKTGKWYISIDGGLVKGVWLSSAEDAMQKANEYVERL